MVFANKLQESERIQIGRGDEDKMTYRTQVLSIAHERYGTELETPFAKYPDYVVLRHPNKKWYGVIMNLPEAKLGISGDQNVDVLNVKCDPLLSGSMRLRSGIFPGYHMNKESWISLLLDGTVPMEEIGILLDISYNLIGTKKTTGKPQAKRSFIQKD